MSTIDHDDPRLTAYAMNELEGAARAEFEALLNDDPVAQAEVEAIRAFGGALEGEMQKAPCPALTDVQRARVVQAAAPTPVAPVAWTRPWFLRPEALAAAGLVGAIGLGLWSSSVREQIVVTTEGAAGEQAEVEAIREQMIRDLQSRQREIDDLKLRQETIHEELREARLLIHGRENDEVKYDHFKTPLEDLKNEIVRERARHERDFRLEEARLQKTVSDLENRSDPTPAPVLSGEYAGAGAVPAGTNVHGVPADEHDERSDRLRDIDAGTSFSSGSFKEDPAVGGGVNGDPADTPLGTIDMRFGGFLHPKPVPDNPFKPAAADPLSTFSVDVDTAAYANVRRYLQQQSVLPPPAAVRLEELINYFSYDYPAPTGEHPFAANVEVASCPWAPANRLVRVGLKGREQAAVDRPATNLVFLIDVSGSMSAVNKLPLVKRSLELLVEQLRAQDRVAIVVYAGASGVVLESTPGDRKAEVRAALERLSAGGGTNGGAGIQLAYDLASRHFAEGGGVNRVVLCTDGDWNVGVQTHERLQALIEEKAKSNVFLTVLGFGMDHRDTTLELLADKGNGNYAFVDTTAEARKVLVDQLSSTLITIAKDVKVQVEWNRDAVASYRLLGYENRVLAARDFADDTKDAGEIGAGHTVTALYEVVPTSQPKGQRQLMTLRLRYKEPLGDVSRLLEQPAVDQGQTFEQASPDFRFAAGVAAFGLVLRQSPHKGTATLGLAHALVRQGVGKDPHGLRRELVDLIEVAGSVANVSLTPPPPNPAPVRPVAPAAPDVAPDAPEPTVVLENLDDGLARFQVSGNAPDLPDGTLLHVALRVEGPEPPIEAAFFRVTVKSGRYEGNHGWERRRFAPLVYRTEVQLVMQVQPPPVKRFLARELGWPLEHVEVIGAARTLLGTDEERRAHDVATLGALRDLQVGASTLSAELESQLDRPVGVFTTAALSLQQRLRALRDEVERLDSSWVVCLDRHLVSALRGALVTLDTALFGRREDRERARELFATAVEDVRRVGEAIERRLPR
jgi:Ca-activated chloride channel family protein